MKKIEHTFDVCFVAFSEINTDARLLNIARTYAQNNLKVGIIAIGETSDIPRFAEENIIFFPVRKSYLKRTWLRWLSFNYYAKKYLKICSCKVAFASDFYSLYLGRKLKKKYNSKLIYDSREIYSALGPLFQSPLKQRILIDLERKWLNDVEQIVVSAPKDADYIREFYKLNHSFEVILNLPPFKEKVNSNLIRAKYHIPQNKNILIYQGMILPGRGLVPLISSLPFLPDSYLCIFGDGPLKSQLSELAKSLKVEDRVIFAGNINYDELHNWTCSADIGICFIEPISVSYQYALPNKLFEYSMAGIPTLASNLFAIKEIIDNNPIGKAIPQDSSPREIALAVQEILNNIDFYKEQTKIAAPKYCFESQTNTILLLLK